METLDQQSTHQELTVGAIVSGAFSIGLKNAASLIGASILWLLTIWIPYINVGTTIALVTIPAKLSHGKVISPFEIFNSKYRKPMGDFFILAGLMNIAITIALLFMVIPGFVLALSWSLAPMLLVNQGLTPTQALTTSNQRTYGHKWTIFFGTFVLGLIIFVIEAILGYITTYVSQGLGSILLFIFLVVTIPIFLGAQAVIYRQLGGEKYD